MLSNTKPMFLDRFLFVYYCFSNCLFYALVKFYHDKFSNLETLEVVGYVNILSFIVLFPYYTVKHKVIHKLFDVNKKLLLTVPSSLLKVFCIGHVSPKNAMVTSFLNPGVITLISFLALGEQDKKHKMNYLWLIVAFSGVVIFAGANFKEHSLIYSLLFIHVFLRALVNVFMKKVSKPETRQDRCSTLFYMFLFYSLSYLIIIVGYYQRFNWNYLFSKEIIMLSLLSASCQLAQIKSYEITKRISLLQHLDYSRILFSFLIGYLVFGEIAKWNEIVGVLVVTGSVFLSFQKPQNWLKTRLLGVYKNQL